jgi:hypothetical protein
MLIQKRVERSGVDVHLEPDECEQFVKLSIDAEKADIESSPTTYFTLSVALGQRIRALREAPVSG